VSAALRAARAAPGSVDRLWHPRLFRLKRNTPSWACHELSGARLLPSMTSSAVSAPRAIEAHLPPLPNSLVRVPRRERGNARACRCFSWPTLTTKIPHLFPLNARDVSGLLSLQGIHAFAETGPSVAAHALGPRQCMSQLPRPGSRDARGECLLPGGGDCWRRAAISNTSTIMSGL
jgi:hypothetical protein